MAEIEERPAKRFKHQSYPKTLKDVHPKSALNQNAFDYEIADTSSQFHEALERWRELSLSPVFMAFSKQAGDLVSSMVLLLHHWEQVLELWFTAMDGADDEALKPLLDLLQHLAHDLRTTLTPRSSHILHRLLSLFPRPIPAPVLTLLLDTLSSLFKYVIIPTEDGIHLAWDACAQVLPECIPEVKRVVAELWGATLRRIKASDRERCAVAIVTMSDQDVGAWTLVSACKSVSQTLHTITASLFTPLMQHYLSCEQPEGPYTVLRRTLTALAHHCKTPDQYAPTVEHMIEQLVSADRSDVERLRRLLELLSVSCSVRQGSRLTQKQLATITSQFQSIPLQDELHASTLKYITSCLTAGEMILWMGPGRKVFERAWDQRPVFALELTGILSDLNWGGWKLIAYPWVMKMAVPRMLEEEEEGRWTGKTLEVLVALKRQGRLEGVDAGWKGKLLKWVEARFGEWDGTTEQMLVLNQVFQLAELLPSLSPIVIRIIEATLQCPNPIEDYEHREENTSWLLGSCLRCVSQCKASEWANMVDLIAWTETIIQKWAWSEFVLGGLVSVLAASPSFSSTLPLDDLYSALEPSLLSHSRTLRLNILRLLSSPAVKSPPGTTELVKRALSGEEVALDVQGVRERVLKITRLGQGLRDDDIVGARIALRWLVAQLKVNLRPLWSPAGEAIAALSNKFGDLTWKLLFDELQKVSQEDVGYTNPPWMKDLSDDDLDPIKEEEKTWRDPNAHKVRLAVALWMRGDVAHRAIIQSQTIPDRFDQRSYETQILASLCKCPSLAEKHSRDLIPFFLSLAPPDDPAQMPRQKLVSWLELLSKFTNPKALRSSEDVHKIYLTLVSHPDRPLQRLALSCLLTFKSPHLLPHQDALRALLDDTRWRDELTNLDLSEIEETHRPEFVDVLVRLLFGVMLERRGKSRIADRRVAVLAALNGCAEDELGLLVDLMLAPLGKGRGARSDDSEGEAEFKISALGEEVTEKQMVGFLTLLEDVMRNLGSRVVKFWPSLLGALLDVIAYAQSQIENRNGTNETEDPGEEGGEEDADEEDKKGHGLTRTITTIRQLGLKRLADFFKSPVTLDFTPYAKAAFDAFISPRLTSFALENTQAPSALLQLFYAWSSRSEYVSLLSAYDERILPQVYNCLVATNVKPPVVSRVFDIVDHLLGISSDDGDVLNTVFNPHVALLLANISTMVSRTKGLNSVTDPLGRRQISILSQIAPYLTDSNQALTLLTLFIPVLRKPSRLVPEKIKVDMISILQNLFSHIPDLSKTESAIYTKTYSLLSFLFQNLRSRPGRSALLSTFCKFAEINPGLQRIADLLGHLDAYSTRRIDEPDFDKRLAAFTNLNETLHKTLSPGDWLPVIYDMLHFIQNPEELIIRSNASLALKRFVDVVAGSDAAYEPTFLKVLYPGLKNGLRTKSELVRTEILGILSYAVERCARIETLQEMRVLLANGDEEANFFYNIHHVQVHRRTRAVRRLAEYCNEGHLRNVTLTDVFIPLVANFIQSSASGVDHHLVNEAILTTGKMAKHLTWGSYYALVQQYLRLSKQKDGSERVYIRTIVSILDNFHFSMDTVVKESDSATAEKDPEVQQGEDDVEEEEVVDEAVAKQIFQQAHIADVVNTRLLPALLQHLEKRDETEDTLRIPIAVGIIQIALHLPKGTREIQISRLLTVLSQILRSKSQETRDLVRETLCKIAIILGPSYLHTIIRELRSALTRGSYLHILAFTTHSLLVHVTAGEHASTFHTLDDSVADVAHISAEVIFGESGKDVAAEGFKTKMREVRASGSKGFDAFAIMAKCITPPKISGLLLPVRNILHETETLKVMQQAEELLHRIAGGLNANDHLKPVDLLSLCHSLISQNSKFLKETPKPLPEKGGKGKKNDDAIVQLKRKLAPDMNHYANNSFRFIVFGLELFNTGHRRSRFDFQDTAILSRLESMVTVIGNTLYSSQQQVIVPGLKATAAIVKCPLKTITKSLPVFIRQIIEIIRQVGSTESDVAQTALKSLAAILRDQPSSQVKEKDLIFLLELLSPDLEEPNRQQSVFAMLRAIVARKFVVPEIYDIMAKTSEIMVTNQSSQVQELARGVLLQFLLEYPQGKGRLRNQMTFLAKNLSYVHESGRKSVMELLSAVLNKFNPDLLREYSDLLFVALVMAIANDDSAKCREMASELVKGLFSRLEDSQRKVILSHVHSWSVQHNQPQLCRVSSQIYSIIIDFLQKDVSAHALLILGDLNTLLQASANALDAVSLSDQAVPDLEWQIPYHALIALSKLLQACPDLTPQMDKVQWSLIISHLLFPHAWVRTTSCRLLGFLFSAVPPAKPNTSLEGCLPFSRVGMEEVATKLCAQLRSENLDSSLSLQITKNLFYIGKCFSLVGGTPSKSEGGHGNESENDSGDESEGEEDGDEDGEQEEAHRKHPLPWLFSKLSYQVRSAHIARRNKSSSLENWYHQPASIFRWFAAMATHLEAPQLERYLPHILSPLYRISEDETIRDAHMDELKTLAAELQDMVQNKVGATKFSGVYNQIRQSVLGVRHERKTKRAVQTTANPAAALKRKHQRNVAKKDSRKRKHPTFAQGRGKVKRKREE